MEGIYAITKSATDENTTTKKIEIGSWSQALDSWRLGEQHRQWRIYKISVSCSIRQDDVVWRSQSDEVPNVSCVKSSAKVMIWGAMGVNGLSKLHISPSGKTINAKYYVEKILQKELKPALNWPKKHWQDWWTKVGSISRTRYAGSRWCDTSHCPSYTELV